MNSTVWAGIWQSLALLGASQATQRVEAKTSRGPIIQWQWPCHHIGHLNWPQWEYGNKHILLIRDSYWLLAWLVDWQNEGLVKHLNTPLNNQQLNYLEIATKNSWMQCYLELSKTSCSGFPKCSLKTTSYKQVLLYVYTCTFYM